MRGVVAALAVVTMSIAGLAGCGGDEGDRGSTEEFCGLDDKINLGGFDSTDDVTKALDDAVDAAPAEIKADMETVRDTIGDVSDQLPDRVAEDLSQLTPEQSEVLDAFETEEFQQASADIQQFLTDNCGTTN